MRTVRVMIIVRAEVVSITALLTSVQLMKRSEANVMIFNFYDVLIITCSDF